MYLEVYQRDYSSLIEKYGVRDLHVQSMYMAVKNETRAISSYTVPVAWNSSENTPRASHISFQITLYFTQRHLSTEKKFGYQISNKLLYIQVLE